MIWAILIPTWVASGILSFVIYILRQKNSKDKDCADDFYLLSTLALIFGYLSVFATIISGIRSGIIELYNWAQVNKPEIETPTIYQETNYRNSAKK